MNNCAKISNLVVYAVIASLLTNVYGISYPVGSISHYQKGSYSPNVETSTKPSTDENPVAETYKNLPSNYKGKKIATTPAKIMEDGHKSPSSYDAKGVAAVETNSRLLHENEEQMSIVFFSHTINKSKAHPINGRKFTIGQKPLLNSQAKGIRDENVSQSFMKNTMQPKNHLKSSRVHFTPNLKSSRKDALDFESTSGLDISDPQSASRIHASDRKSSSNLDAPDIKSVSRVEISDNKSASRFDASDIKPAARVDTLDIISASRVDISDIKSAYKVETPDLKSADKVAAPSLELETRTNIDNDDDLNSDSDEVENEGKMAINFFPSKAIIPHESRETFEILRKQVQLVSNKDRHFENSMILPTLKDSAESLSTFLHEDEDSIRTTPVWKDFRGKDTPICMSFDEFCQEDPEYDAVVEERFDKLLKNSNILNDVFSDILIERELPVNESHSFRIDIRDGASFPSESPVCLAYESIIYPRRGKTDKEDYVFILNQGKTRQGIRVEKCIEEGSNCQIGGGDIHKTTCRQKYIYKRMLTIDNGGAHIVPESILMPSCCICYVRNDFVQF